MSLYEGKMKCLLFVVREKKKKKTDLHLNCLQISRDDCCSFLHLTGFYQIQKGWTRKKTKTSAIRSHTGSHLEADNRRACLHTDIPITWSRQYQYFCVHVTAAGFTRLIYRLLLPDTVCQVPAGAPVNVLFTVYHMLVCHDRFGQSVL